MTTNNTLVKLTLDVYNILNRRMIDKKELKATLNNVQNWDSMPFGELTVPIASKHINKRIPELTFTNDFDSATGQSVISNFQYRVQTADHYCLNSLFNRMLNEIVDVTVQPLFKHVDYYVKEIVHKQIMFFVSFLCALHFIDLEIENFDMHFHGEHLARFLNKLKY